MFEEFNENLIDFLRPLGDVNNDFEEEIVFLIPDPSRIVFDINDFNLIVGWDEVYLNLFYFKKDFFKKQCLYSSKSGNAYVKELAELPEEVRDKSQKLFNYLICFYKGGLKQLPKHFIF